MPIASLSSQVADELLVVHYFDGVFVASMTVDARERAWLWMRGDKVMLVIHT